MFSIFMTACLCFATVHPLSSLRFQDTERRFRKDLNFLYGIYPGTKWCGRGNVSSGLDDLGKLKRVDSCCMKHDNCPISINPGQTKYGITNRGLYPISHCGCDDALFNCLKNLEHDEDAQFVGEIYFDILRIQCFIKEHPRRCIKWHWWGACKKYKELKDQKPVVQMVDPRKF